MNNEDKILKKLDRLERLVGILVQKEVKIQWVKASTILDITGWDKERLRRARIYGDVEFKKQNGIWYNLNSVPKIYYKIQTT